MSKEASVKVKPFMAYGADDDDGPYSVVHVARYDAILALALELRSALLFEYGREPFAPQHSATCNCQKCVAIRNSAWLEE